MRTLSNALTSDVVNVVLALLHTIDVLLEADQLITRLGGLVAEELCDLHTVGGILVHTKLEAFTELFVELLVVVLLLSNLGWMNFMLEHCLQFRTKTRLEY